MSLLWVLILSLACVSYSRAIEQYCRQFEYDEKMLSKMIKNEIAMETLMKKLKTMESGMEKRILTVEKQNMEENIQAASIDGGWTDWSSWTECTTSCGVGIQSRYRTCDNPARYLNGKMCNGPPTEYRSCSNQPCDIANPLAAKGSPAQTVGFTVKSSSKTLKNGVLQFTTVISNDGDAFNKTTGKFVCDVPGLYFFSATILGGKATDSVCRCNIYVNSSAETFAFAYRKNTGDFPSGSASLVYELKTGDEVYLGSCINVGKFQSSGTHFSGVLIKTNE